MKNRIYEHLKTRKKYNTLELKYDVKCEELEHKIIELNTERKTRIKQQEIFNQKLEKLTEENLDLKQKVAELKKELKSKGGKK